MNVNAGDWGFINSAAYYKPTVTLVMSYTILPRLASEKCTHVLFHVFCCKAWTCIWVDMQLTHELGSIGVAFGRSIRATDVLLLPPLDRLDVVVFF